jgi:hypothetical protein
MWAFNSILEFLQIQKERFNRKGITAGTIRNYVESIKLFCQMADVSIPWEKLQEDFPEEEDMLMIGSYSRRNHGLFPDG